MYILAAYNLSTTSGTVFGTEGSGVMIATKQMDVRANIKKYFDMAFDGEPVIVSRKENRNVVIISETEYNELEKVKKNAEYLAKLYKADEQIKNGQVVTKTMDELLEMEK